MRHDYHNMTPAKLAELVEELQGDLKAAQMTLAAKQLSCAHQWSETVYDPIVHEGHQDPGDPPGTMGVDRRLPMWVPRQEIPRWRRTCPKCCKTEITSRTHDDVRTVPVF